MRTKLFLIGYFLPAWIASLMMWGDDRTSASFQTAPRWFFVTQLAVQFAAILLLFLPPRVRQRPSLAALFLSMVVIVSLYLSDPVLEAEFVLISGSILIALVTVFLSIARPSATFKPSDIALLFYLFVAGFLLQIFMFVQFGRLPSHSITDTFVRFNGITNDSLASGFIIALFIPWAVSSRFAVPKVLAVVGMAAASGSLFSVLFVPVMVFGYLIYYRLYGFAMLIVLSVVGFVLAFYQTLLSIIELKLLSIMSHLRFFLNLAGVNLQQSRVSCSEEFCESFIESGMYLSPVYLIAFCALMACFIAPVFRSARAAPSFSVIPNTLRVYALALVAGSLVHPVPLIPFAIPLFLVLSSLYLGDGSAVRPALAVKRGARPSIA